MNQRLELFYILPHTRTHHDAEYYYNDDNGCNDYRPAFESDWVGDPLIFDNKNQLLKWFYENTDELIPTVYRIRYLASYKGVDDVIKITNLGNGETNYYTALNEDSYAWYDAEASEDYRKRVWQYFDQGDGEFQLGYMYEEFAERGVQMKYDVSEDKTDCFEFCGDIHSWKGKGKIKGKKLILNIDSDCDYI